MYFKKIDKILFFLPSFEDGGAEESIISLANQFYKKKMNILFLVGNTNGKNKKKIEKRIDLINLNKDRLRKCFWITIKILKRWSPKVIITTLTHSNLFFCFLKIFLKHNFKLIIRETNINPPKYKTFSQFLKFSLFNFLKKNLYNQAEYVIAINSKSRQELISLGIDKNKIKIFNNPSIKENFIIKAKKKIPEKKLISKDYILYVGRLASHKNLDFLIKTFYKIQKKININLVLIGQGGETQKLKNLANQFKIKQKVFFKKYNFNPLPFMKKAKLYVSFSDYEGQPNAVIQSLGCGTQVLLKSFEGLDNKLKNNYNLTILNKLDETKAEVIITKKIKIKRKKFFNTKIIKLFSEKQFADKILKLIYA